MLLFLGLSVPLGAQNSSIPQKVEAGKCYERCFYYDKEVEWKQVDCPDDSLMKTEKTKKELIKQKQKKIKLEKYQEKLKRLGYNIDINGFLDIKTIEAHHKYLKVKRKEKKRLKRIEKRKSK